MNISNYTETIRNLKPLSDSKFTYKKDKWLKLNEAYKRFISDFEEKEISRQDIINAYKQFYSGTLGWETAFLLTMVWGFSDTGYGTFRTNNYIGLENREKIINALNAIETNDLEFAYKSLKSIQGLSISYISKVLYFATRACDYKDYALIFDIRVARSLVKLTSLPEIFEIVEINPSSKFAHYKLYNSMIHNYSQKYNLEPESLEMFLFKQEF
ncbi:8-oxoguanine DNA glycosylase OGG fold protein [Flavobacterium silvaticum]|uniref:Uncharacterized protein n=1 Tax=Flavobacterium silvaticum TaxID=1852020 RepID=A0A972FX63_9FLAO|nr:hypothetical protein [Flavobacterium silvaticum]NMH26481.1 hypothetical protein [Flavobacterium silvaticum]